MKLVATDAWRAAYPAAHAGVLAMEGVSNPENHPGLEERKQALEARLRARWGGLDRAALKQEPALAAYAAYYRAFKKSYHVQAQIESIAFKGRSIPRVAALVEAMFMAELGNGLLTAGHDLDVVQPPVRIDVAAETESYTRLDGQEQVLKAGDMAILDSVGVLSSILYGPDHRTRIRPETGRVLFTVYAPPGIEPGRVASHLADIRDYVNVVSPGARVVALEVVGG